jgi:hypothetical protein
MKNHLILVILVSSILLACGGSGGSDASPSTVPRKDSTGGGNFLDMPPVDLACVTDADCTFGPSVRLIESACCYGCPSFPVNVSWRRLLVKRCNAHNGEKTSLPCPKLKCRPMLKVGCRDRRCVVE